MHFNPPQNDKTSPFFHPLNRVNEEVKTIDKKKAKDIYDKLKKGSEIEVDFGNSLTRGGTPITLKVTSGHRVVGASRVGRIILVNKENPRGMKYKLFDRNGSVSLAQGDMGTILRDMKIVKEGVEIDESRDDFDYLDIEAARQDAKLEAPKVVKTRNGFQVMVYSRKLRKHIPQGMPHRTKAAAEKDAKMFEDVDLDEGSAKDKRMMKSVKDKLTKAGIKNAVMFGEVHVAPNNVKEAEKIVGSMPFKVVPQKKLKDDVQLDETVKTAFKGAIGNKLTKPNSIGSRMLQNFRKHANPGDGFYVIDGGGSFAVEIHRVDEMPYGDEVKKLGDSDTQNIRGKKSLVQLVAIKEDVQLDEAKAEFQFSDKATALKFMREVSQARQGSSTGTRDGKVTTDFTDLGDLELKSVARIMKKYGGKLIKISERQMAKVFEEYTELEEERGSKIQVMVKGDRNAYERLTRAITMGKVPGYEGAMFKGKMTTLTFDAKKHTGAVRRKLAKMIKDSGGEFDRSIEEQLDEKEYKPHKMYHPTTGEEVDAKTREDHLKFKAMGYLHDKPEMEEGFASDAQRRAAFASGYKAKGKKK